MYTASQFFLTVLAISMRLRHLQLFHSLQGTCKTLTTCLHMAVVKGGGEDIEEKKERISVTVEV